MIPLENAVIERHVAEPRIAEELIAMLRRARERGQATGFRSVWEVLRWRADVELEWTTPFKLNNTLSPIFSRLVLVLAPDLQGAFETRTIRGFDEDAFAARVRARLRMPAEPARQLELPLAPRPVARRVARPKTIASLGEALAAMEVAKRILHATRRRAA
jgi:hypothetical protein